MKKKKRRYSKATQETVARLLTELMFCQNMEDVQRFWQITYDDFDLKDDPYTHCPVGDKEYAESCEKYTRDAFYNKFGYYGDL